MSTVTDATPIVQGELLSRLDIMRSFINEEYEAVLRSYKPKLERDFIDILGSTSTPWSMERVRFAVKELEIDLQDEAEPFIETLSYGSIEDLKEYLELTEYDPNVDYDVEGFCLMRAFNNPETLFYFLMKYEKVREHFQTEYKDGYMRLLARHLRFTDLAHVVSKDSYNDLAIVRSTCACIGRLDEFYRWVKTLPLTKEVRKKFKATEGKRQLVSRISCSDYDILVERDLEFLKLIIEEATVQDLLGLLEVALVHENQELLQFVLNRAVKIKLTEDCIHRALIVSARYLNVESMRFFLAYDDKLVKNAIVDMSEGMMLRPHYCFIIKEKETLEVLKLLFAYMRIKTRYDESKLYGSNVLLSLFDILKEASKYSCVSVIKLILGFMFHTFSLRTGTRLDIGISSLNSTILNEMVEEGYISESTIPIIKRHGRNVIPLLEIPMEGKVFAYEGVYSSFKNADHIIKASECLEAACSSNNIEIFKLFWCMESEYIDMFDCLSACWSIEMLAKVREITKGIEAWDIAFKKYVSNTRLSINIELDALRECFPDRYVLRPKIRQYECNTIKKKGTYCRTLIVPSFVNQIVIDDKLLEKVLINDDLTLAIKVLVLKPVDHSIYLLKAISCGAIGIAEFLLDTYYYLRKVVCKYFGETVLNGITSSPDVPVSAEPLTEYKDFATYYGRITDPYRREWLKRLLQKDERTKKLYLK